MTPQMTATAEAFGRRLAALMADKGWSQSDFAREVWGEIENSKTGHRSARGRDRVSAYVNGKSMPSPKLLAQMAKALDMTPEALAPDLAGAAAPREKPAFTMIVPAGRPDMVHVTVDMLLPTDLAPELMALLNRARKPT
jgi:transcriptional regulator with XRE-family HTH domain